MSHTGSVDKVEGSSATGTSSGRGAGRTAGDGRTAETALIGRVNVIAREALSTDSAGGTGVAVVDGSCAGLTNRVRTGSGIDFASSTLSYAIADSVCGYRVEIGIASIAGTSSSAAGTVQDRADEVAGCFGA